MLLTGYARLKTQRQISAVIIGKVSLF